MHKQHLHSHLPVASLGRSHMRTRLKIVFAIYLAIIVTELVGAYLAHSLALLAEAIHMAIDSNGILITLVATYMAGRRADKRHTFGMLRIEIVAVLLNCALLLRWVGLSSTRRYSVSPIRRPSARAK